MRLPVRPARFSRDKRRPAPRVRPLAAQPVEIQVMGTGTLDVLHARDISTSGVGIYVPHRFRGCDIDSEVELVVTLPKRRPFLTRGVIRHVTRHGEPTEYFGVEFTDLRDAHRKQIQAYVMDLEARAPRLP